MVAFSAVRTDISEQRMKEYDALLDDMDVYYLLKEFFSYLDYKEESDSGREFHPVTIGSCRVLLSEPLDKVMKKLRNIVKENT